MLAANQLEKIIRKDIEDSELIDIRLYGGPGRNKIDKKIQKDVSKEIITHNPLVLDGLDLANDDIRLFTTDRNKYGHVEVRRVQISNELLDM